MFAKRSTQEAKGEPDLSVPLVSKCGNLLVRLFSRCGVHYGWVMVACAAALILCSGPGHSFVIAPFVDRWIAEFQLSRTRMSLYWMCSTFTSAALIPFAGRLIDTVGVQWTLWATPPCYAMGLCLMSQIGAGWQLNFCLVFNRFIMGDMMPIQADVLLGSWFQKKLGKAGLAISVTSSMLFALPLLITILIDFVGSWRTAFLYIAVIASFLLVPAALLSRNSPAAVGLLPDLQWEAEKGIPEDSVRLAEGCNGQAWTFGDVLRTYHYWVIIFSMFPISVWHGMSLHMVSICHSVGLDKDAAMLAFMVFALANFTTSIISNSFLLDEMRRPHVLLGIANIGMATALAILIMAPHFLLASAICFGAAHGFFASTFGVILAKYYGTTFLGQLQGSKQAALILFAGVSPVFFGIAADNLGAAHGYRMLFWVYLVMNIVWGAVVVMMPRPPSMVPASYHGGASNP